MYEMRTEILSRVDSAFQATDDTIRQQIEQQRAKIDTATSNVQKEINTANERLNMLLQQAER